MPRKFVYYNRTKRPKLKYPEYLEDYVDYEVHQEKKSTGPGVDDFEIIDVVEEHKVNIKEFINSFNDKAGMEALLKRVELTGDLSLLNQTEALHADMTIIPEDPEQALTAANSAEQLYAALDPELTKGANMKDFISGLTPEKLEEYIKARVEKELAKDVKKDEDSK